MQPTSWQKIERERLSDQITRQMINGEKATLARFELAKGAVVPRHVHVNEQFSMILSGALKFTFDHQEVIVRAGEMVIISGNEPHAAEALEDSVVLDFFVPRREDWLRRDDAYLRRSGYPPDRGASVRLQSDHP